MSGIDERVNRHYGWSGLMATIEEEIRRKGIDPARVTVDELAPVDNYHWHRLAGTLALARAAAISAADSVLDVGGGIGGPARQLAHRHGCRVTVLDLTAEYCAVGQALTAWTTLEDKVRSCAGTRSRCPLRRKLRRRMDAARFDEHRRQGRPLPGDGPGRPRRRPAGLLRRPRRA